MLASQLVPRARHAALQLAAVKPRLAPRHTTQIHRYIHSASVRAQVAAESSVAGAAEAAPKGPDGHSDWYYIGIASAVLFFLGGPAYVVHMLREDTETYQLVRELASGFLDSLRCAAMRRTPVRCSHAQFSSLDVCCSVWARTCRAV